MGILEHRPRLAPPTIGNSPRPSSRPAFTGYPHSFPGAQDRNLLVRGAGDLVQGAGRQGGLTELLLRGGEPALAALESQESPDGRRAAAPNFGKLFASGGYRIGGHRDDWLSLSTMGTIINLYVIPRHQNPSNVRAAQVAEAVVSEHLVAPPVVIGPALGARGHQDWLVQPQQAGWLHRLSDLGASVTADDADFVCRSRRYAELPRTFADFGSTDGPQIAAFTRLDETNPAIRRDFNHYTGPECSVGIYVARRGFRLLLEPPFDGDPVFDRTVFEWLHLELFGQRWMS